MANSKLGALHGLDGLTSQGNDSWLARCPVHDDKTPSLSLTWRGDQLLWHCHAGCSQKDVGEELRQLGINKRESSARAARPVRPRKFTLELDSNETTPYALTMWAEAERNPIGVPSEHPYSTKKQMTDPVHCRRGIVSGRVLGQKADCLLVPQYDLKIDNRQIIGVECINAEGKKQTFGGKGICQFGDERNTHTPIHVCEGYATAYTLWRYLPKPSLVYAVFSKTRMSQFKWHCDCRELLQGRVRVHHEMNNRDFWDFYEDERQEYVKPYWGAS